jgi:transcriptional regulator with XRE-family HTH domain
MARPRKSEPNPVSDAVQKLRNCLNQTQQEFANSLGVAITTVARWETTRPPKGRALSDLNKLALENKQWELAKIFGDALADELGLTEIVGPARNIIISDPPVTFLPPRTDEEAAVADAAIAMWRDKKGRPVLKSAIGSTIEMLKLLQRHYADDGVHPDLWERFIEQVWKGESIREVCKRLKLPYAVWNVASGKGHMEGWKK